MAATMAQSGSSSGGPSTPLSTVGISASVKSENSRQSSTTPMDLDEGGQAMSVSSSMDSKGKGREIVEQGEGDVSSEAERIAKEKAEVAHLGEEGELDEKEEIELATIPRAKIVGLPHYRGVATLKKNQDLSLQRDHLNISDKNAIEVRQSTGIKIGMLSKTLAQRLAPLIDAHLIEVEGVSNDVPTHTVGVQSIDATIKIYGTRAAGRDSRLDFVFPLRSKRKADDIAAAEEAARIEALGEEKETGPSNPDSDKKILNALIQQSEYDRPNTDLLTELFQEGASDPSALPIHPCPPGRKDKTMRSELMPFQKQGLAWMIKMEHPSLPKTPEDPPVQLWMKKLDAEGETYWYNLGTDTSQREKPVLKRGGILADEMGLGKTMQTIALIVTDDTGAGVLPEPEEPDERYDDMTLIVCPMSVASNWTDQFHSHVGSKRLKWHLFHGEGRDLTKKQLRKFDVVITTYQTVGAELNASPAASEGEPAKKKAKPSKPKEGVLQSIKWRRVVLDEGHIIKNPRAKMSIACAMLKAERRWILTGTPIINSTTDLGAMITFLKLCRPLDQREEWMRHVERKAKSPEGAQLLRAIVSSTTLRRTKDMSDSSGRLLVSLPEIKFYYHKIQLTPDARVLYDEIAAQLKAIVGRMVAQGTASTNYSTVLVFLLRLRQLACDPALCPQSFIDMVHEHRLAAKVEADLASGPHLDVREITRLQRILQKATDNNDMCAHCNDSLVEPVITTCEHIFCHECITSDIKKYQCCPVDQEGLTTSQLIEPAENEGYSASDEEEVLARQKKDGLTGMSAAKTNELINILNATEPGVKSLVFSQWTSHLNCIEAALSAAGIVSCRFDGSMTQQKRQSIISTFSTPLPEVTKKTKPLKKGQKGPPTVMLISLKAGALGLNLTCASQVFLMDPWWQASIEQQAIDRVYRIGQTKPVRVFQLVAENTVEDRVLKIQEAKQSLISQAFSGNKTSLKETAKIDSHLQDIATIFGV